VPDRDRAATGDLLDGVLDELAQQPHAVDQRAAVFVVAQVVAPGQEVLRPGEPVAGVDVDQVIAGLQAAADRGAVPLPQLCDVGLGHRPGLHGVRPVDRQVRRTQGDLAAGEVRGVHAVVGQLDAGQRAAAVDGLGDPGDGGDVLVGPQPAFDGRGQVRGGVDLDLLGAHDRPPAFCLDLPHPGQGGDVAVAHPVAVRHLEEAVLRVQRADGYWLKQQVMARVAGDRGKAHDFRVTALAQQRP